MNIVKAEKCRTVITDALNNARKTVLCSQEETSKSGKIFILSIAKEKQWFDDYVKSALADSPYEVNKSFAVFGFTNMTFGLGNDDDGFVFLDEGIFFKGSGGGYSMKDFFIRYEDFAKDATIDLVQKNEDQRFGKRTVVSIKVNGADNFIDLANTGCAPEAFSHFLSGVKDDLVALFELNHESEGSEKECAKAGDPDEETVSVGDIAKTYKPRQQTQIKGENDLACNSTKQKSDAPKSEEQVSTTKSTRNMSDISRKKRIVFLLLGGIFGFIGIHFLYAKRYVLFALTLANFTFLVASAAAKQSGLVALSVLLLLVFWPCFTLVGRKDGSKLKMKWF